MRPIFLRNDRLISGLDMLSGPIVAMVWEGRDVVKQGRGKFSLFRVIRLFHPY